ncbi:uncharacterized protein [Ptychodera flava]|uniref:uncharacterized protein n=1 Tax=Ptychodera flava TaxID=63121 RepID=UPI003969EA29
MTFRVRSKKTKLAFKLIYLLLLLNFVLLFYYVNKSSSNASYRGKFGSGVLSEAKLILHRQFVGKVGDRFPLSESNNEKLKERDTLVNKGSVNVSETEKETDELEVLDNVNIDLYDEEDALDVHALSNRGKQRISQTNITNIIVSHTDFVLHNPHLCHKSDKVDIVVLVTSTPENVVQRDAIRQTWGRQLVENPGAILLFVIGRSRSKTTEFNVRQENARHGDIIQAQFHDVTENRVIKTIAIFRWVSLYCRNSKYVLKTSDSTFLQPTVLYKTLSGLKDTTLVYGSVRVGLKAERNPLKKAYISDDVWPSPRYPAFLEYPTYLFTVDITINLYELALEHPLFPVEDIYIGILLENRTVEFEDSALVDRNGETKFVCDLTEMLSVASLYPSTIKNYWSTLTLYGNVCGANEEDNNYIVQQQPVVFVQNPSYRCAQTALTGEVFLLVMVISNPENVAQRYAIRETWANSYQMKTNKAVTMFFVESTDSKVAVLESKIENKQFADIVLVDYQGSNDVLVTLAAMKWAELYCHTAQFIMKLEDDVLFFPTNLVGVVQVLPQDKLALGYVQEPEDKPLKRKGSEWLVDSLEITSISSYIDTHAYVLSYDVTRAILNMTYRPTHTSEEIFISTLLTKLEVRMLHHPGFDSHGQMRDICDLRHAITSRYMLHNNDMMYRYWRSVNEWSPFLCQGSKRRISNALPLHRALANRGQLEAEHNPLHHLDYEYLINHETRCSDKLDNSGKLNILVGVISRAKDIQARQVIRSTWAKKFHNAGPLKAITVFILGHEHDNQRQLEEENASHSDIIQWKINESYKNLTLKTVMFLKWAATYCRNAHYVIKIDSDVFVNVDNMVQLLMTAPRSSFYLGDTKVATQPIRQPRSKWFTPSEAWRDSTYPPYNDGHAYVMSADVVIKAYEASLKSSIFPWEDVYVGALLANIGIAPTPHKLFDRRQVYKDACALSKCLTSHGFEPMKMFYSWTHLEECRERPSECGCLGGKTNATVTLGQTDTSWANQNKRSPEGCLQGEQTELFLLIVVITMPTRYNDRMMARLSWTSRGDFVNGKHTDVVFLMGKTNDVDMQRFIVNESHAEQDIIQGNFQEEDPSNNFFLRHKFAIDWAYSCGAPDYLMIVTDDTFVHVENVIDFLYKESALLPPDMATAYMCIGQGCNCKTSETSTERTTFVDISILSRGAISKLYKNLRHSDVESNIDLLSQYQQSRVSIRSPKSIDYRGRVMYPHKGMCRLHEILASSKFTSNQFQVAFSFLNGYHDACQNKDGQRKRALYTEVCTA